MAIEPNALDRIAGVYPSEVLSATAHTGKKIYGILLDTGASITVCTGTDPDGNAYDWVASKNWDAAPVDKLLLAGQNYVITSITISGGLAIAY